MCLKLHFKEVFDVIRKKVQNKRLVILKITCLNVKFLITIIAQYVVEALMKPYLTTYTI